MRVRTFASATDYQPKEGDRRISFDTKEAAIEFCRIHRWHGVLPPNSWMHSYTACKNRLSASALTDDGMLKEAGYEVVTPGPDEGYQFYGDMKQDGM